MILEEISFIARRTSGIVFIVKEKPCRTKIREGEEDARTRPVLRYSPQVKRFCRKTFLAE